MIASLILALALPTAVAGEANAITLKGRCNYPEAMGAPKLGESRFFCDSVTQAERVVRFSRASSGKTVEFAGDAAGDRMTIRRISLRPGVATAATGYCRTFHRNADISAVSCVARVGWRTYVANFIPSAI